MRFVKSQAGFSLVEAVIGMVLLAILVGAVLSVTIGSDKSSFRKNVAFNASCRTEAQRLMGNFKSKGLVRNYYNFPSRTAVPAGPGGALPAAGVHVRPPGVPGATDPSATEEGIAPAQRWQNTGSADVINTPLTIADPAANTSILRPHTLIMGTISALETIYNNNPAVCAPPGLATPAPAPLNVIFPTPVGVEDSGAENTGLSQPTAYLQIRLFNTTTGAPIAGSCGGAHEHVAMPNERAAGPANTRPINNLPSGLVGGVNHPGASPLPPLIRVGRQDPSVLFNAGFEVTITVEYNNRNGSTERCSATEKFQYPLNLADQTIPLALQDFHPTLENPADDSNTPVHMNGAINSASNIDYGSGVGDLPAVRCDATHSGTVYMRVANARPGSIYMCRNLSAQRPLNDTAGLNTFNVQNINANTYRLRVLRPNGLRQTFYSSELSQNTTARDNGGRPDGVLNSDGFYQYNSLYYPAGNYFCDDRENCPGLPRFDTTGTYFPRATTGHYDLFLPNNHNSQNNTAWNTTYDTGKWIPCEYARVACATNNYSATNTTTFAGRSWYTPITEFVPGAGTRADGYHITYTGLPTGCEVHMQVAEVDPSYNVRAVEFYEYIHEAIPGNFLVFNPASPAPSHRATRSVGWNFVCSTPSMTGRPSTGAFANVPACGTATARSGALPGTGAVYNNSVACYIEYPGTAGVSGDHRDGVWGANPNATEAYPP